MIQDSFLVSELLVWLKYSNVTGSYRGFDALAAGGAAEWGLPTSPVRKNGTPGESGPEGNALKRNLKIFLNHFDNWPILKMRSGIFMRKTGSLALCCMLLGSIFIGKVVAESPGSIVDSLSIFSSDVPHHINSERDWVDICNVEKSFFDKLPLQKKGTVRRWRVKAVYSEKNLAGQSTLQVRLRMNGDKDPVFTLPWITGVNDWISDYSNWFVYDSETEDLLKAGNPVCSVRLAAPPRNAVPGRVFKIVLEVWDLDFSKEGKRDSPNMAFGPSSRLLNTERYSPQAKKSENSRNIDKVTEKRVALDFSFSFIESYLKGDQLGFYEKLNNMVYSLNSGRMTSRYRIAPPVSVESFPSLAQYRATYRHKIYSYDEYIELFPQWVSEDREWTPSKDTYLFMGGESLPGKTRFANSDFFVFLIEKVGGKWKIVGRPE